MGCPQDGVFQKQRVSFHTFASVIACSLLMGILLVLDIPILHRIFAPTVFTNVQVWR